MECNEIRELLSLYIDQMLDDTQMNEVEQHLAICAACKKEYDELLEITELLNGTEMIPVPDSFEFRLKQALKEEKQNIISSASKDKASKKGRWRMITSIAAVFAVGVISFGLYHDVLGVLQDKLNGTDQSQIEQSEDKYGVTAADSENTSDAVDDNPIIMKDEAVNSKATIGATESVESDDTQNFNFESKKKETATKEASSPELEDSKMSTYGMVNDSESDNDDDSSTATDNSDGLVSIDSSTESSVEESTEKSSSSSECSRSFTSSSVERNTAAFQYYNNLIEEKLKGFDYQILGSSYVQTGEWHFRIFIFRGKDGNTYNEEISIIGNEGKIEIICSNEFMGL